MTGLDLEQEVEKVFVCTRKGQDENWMERRFPEIARRTPSPFRASVSGYVKKQIHLAGVQSVVVPGDGSLDGKIYSVTPGQLAELDTSILGADPQNSSFERQAVRTMGLNETVQIYVYRR